MENIEIIKPLNGFNKYLISSLGYIKNKNNRIIKTFFSNRGYPIISLYSNDKIKKSYNFHYLMAENFLIKENDNLEIDHIDGDKTNNKLNNLRYVSHSENQKNRKLWGHKSNKSGHHHIYKCKNFYKVSFKHNKLRHCSYHKNLNDALITREEILSNYMNNALSNSES